MWFFVTAVTETYRWSGWTLSSFVIDIFFMCKIFHNFNIAFDYLLMLTIFHVQNVLIILNWCLCDFLLLKYIDEVDGLPSSFVTYWCWHIFCVENILRFQYCFWLFTDVDYFSCAKCSYHSRLMFMWFSVTEIYWWSARTSCWFAIYLCWHIFCVENILEFQYCFWLFTDGDYFSCAKCSYHSWLMFMWFSVTEIYRWSGWTSIFICHLLMLTYFLCGKYSTISILVFHVQNVLIILNWCLCDFLLLKHIDEVHALHVDLSFTYVDIFFV